MFRLQIRVIALILSALLVFSCSGRLSGQNDARKRLVDAYETAKNVYPRRITETSTFTPRDQEFPWTTVRLIEAAAADRVHVKVSGFFSSEIIRIGDKVYDRHGNKWAETPGPRKSVGPEIESLLSSNLKRVEQEGLETVNDVPCIKYSLTFEGLTGSQTLTGTGETWVAIANGLPLQVDTDVKVGNSTNKTHAVYEYLVEVVVELPRP